MKKIITILFVALTLFSSYSNACRFKAQSIEERFENASYVITAWVTGVELPDFERNKKIRMGKDNSELFVTVGYETEILSLLPIDKYKGRRKPPRKVLSGFCGNGIVELKDKAIFFITKEEGDYTSYAISESNNKEYYQESLAKVKEFSN